MLFTIQAIISMNKNLVCVYYAAKYYCSYGHLLKLLQFIIICKKSNKKAVSNRNVGGKWAICPAVAKSIIVAFLLPFDTILTMIKKGERIFDSFSKKEIKGFHSK